MRDDTKNKRISKINIVLSVLISFAAWLYVVYNIYPTINKSFEDVPITFTGQYELAENGYAIQSAEKTDMNVKLKINRTDLSKISASDISITADVSTAAEGTNNIQLKVSVPEGVSIKSQEMGIITVEVLPVTSKDVPLLADYVTDATASTDEGNLYEPVIDRTEYKLVSVYGTADNLKNVQNATAYLTKAILTSSESKELTVNPTAVDEDGNTVPYITVFPSEIEIEAHNARVKKVSLSVRVKDEASDGITRTYEAPSSVYVKGSTKALNSISSIQTEEININGISTDTELLIEYNLPDGVYISNRSLNQKLNVTVEANTEK